MPALKKIYMAKSMAALKITAEKTEQATGKIAKPGDNHVKSLERLYSEAEKSLESGDEERAFVLFFRFTSMFIKLQAKADDKKYLTLMIGNKIGTSMSQAEKLEESLEKRYKILSEMIISNENSPPAGNSPSEKVGANSTNTVSNNPGSLDENSPANENGDLVTNNVIKCMDFYEFLETEVKNKKNALSSSPVVLVLDCRPSQDFKNSQIKLTSFLKDKSDQVVILNIPDEALRPGLAMVALEKSLDSKIVASLKLRKTVKKVVILDWTSEELNNTTTNNLSVLFNALWKVGYLCYSFVSVL